MDFFSYLTHFSQQRVWGKIHRQALLEGAESYRDPASGYHCFTALKLKKNGACCGSGCRHCPYRVLLPVGLAPMEGVTEMATRFWFWQVAAPKLMWTPFLRATDTFPNKKMPLEYVPELYELAAVTPYHLIPQIMASRAEDLVRAASILPQHVPFVDLNAGCPSPTVISGAAGSSLLRDRQHFATFLNKAVDGLGQRRLSVKMRTGFHSFEEFSGLLEVVQKIPLLMLTIHGRTREDRYRGEARWQAMDQASTALPYPVVGSGDIVSLPALLQRRETAPECGAFIVGRGALRYPWIFLELASGTAPQVSWQLVKLALTAFGLMQWLQEEAPEKLIAAMAKIFRQEPCLLDERRWQELVEELGCVAGVTDTRRLEEVPIPKVMLPRLKMLWHYLRSSLGDPLQGAQVLRSTSFGEFLQRVDGFADEGEHAGAGRFTLRHRSAADWIYSGQKTNSPNPSGSSI